MACVVQRIVGAVVAGECLSKGRIGRVRNCAGDKSRGQRDSQISPSLAQRRWRQLADEPWLHLRHELRRRRCRGRRFRVAAWLLRKEAAGRDLGGRARAERVRKMKRGTQRREKRSPARGRSGRRRRLSSLGDARQGGGGGGITHSEMQRSWDPSRRSWRFHTAQLLLLATASLFCDALAAAFVELPTVLSCFAGLFGLAKAEGVVAHWVKSRGLLRCDEGGVWCRAIHAVAVARRRGGHCTHLARSCGHAENLRAQSGISDTHARAIMGGAMVGELGESSSGLRGGSSGRLRRRCRRRSRLRLRSPQRPEAAVAVAVAVAVVVAAAVGAAALPESGPRAFSVIASTPSSSRSPTVPPNPNLVETATATATATVTVTATATATATVVPQTLPPPLLPPPPPPLLLPPQSLWVVLRCLRG